MTLTKKGDLDPCAQEKTYRSKTEALGDTVISNFQFPKLGENKVLVMVGLTDVAMC